MNPNFPKPGDYDNDNLDPWSRPTIHEINEDELFNKCLKWFLIGAASATVGWHLLDWWTS